MNAKVEGSTLAQKVSLTSAGNILVDPAKIPAQDLPGGDLRIPIASLTAPLEYQIPQPQDQFARDRLTVDLRVKGTATLIPIVPRLDLGPVADRVWPLPLFIPLSELRELATPEAPTEWELIYILYANGVNPSPPVITEYHIDRTKPYQTKTPATDFSPPAISFPADLPPSKDIDDAYLGANPTGIKVAVTLAANANPSDVCDVYWGVPSDPAYATPVMKDVLLPASGEILIPVDIFQKSTEGLNTLTFIVRDLAGNISRQSKPNQRNVRRLAPPVPLPPVVPLADGTGGDMLIDVADCKLGVTIEVPVPLPNSPSDTIIAKWQGISLPEQRVGTSTTLIFPVDYTTVIKVAYGSTDGPVPTTVSYEMFRGSGAPIATEKADIAVDISYPGPVNPDEPSEVNPLLELPRLVSSQAVDNELDDNDYGEDAEIFIKLYDAPPTESAQSVTVFYDDQELTPPWLLQPGEEGTEIGPFNVPWSVIERKQIADVKIKWRLTAVGGANPVFSNEETVVVNITKIDLPKVLVQGLIFDEISCPTLNFLPVDDPSFPGDGTNRRNLKVNIPFSASLLDGRTVTLKWQGYEDESATIPIAGTLVTRDINISGTVPPEGIETDIGVYMTHFKPVSDGYGKLTYSITGVVPESDAAVHFVFLLDNDGDYCEIANPVP